jgi:hypothetical protein
MFTSKQTRATHNWLLENRQQVTATTYLPTVHMTAGEYALCWIRNRLRKTRDKKAKLKRQSQIIIYNDAAQCSES